MPSLGVVDRCITCHAGVDDPRMADEAQPFRAHPGTLVADHPPEEFGCTVCHQGQGRATETQAAHGQVDHWLYPMFGKPYRYAACSKCHDEDSLYGDTHLLARSGGGVLQEGAVAMTRGRQLLEEHGCRGCHKVNSQGGTLGPDISLVGDKIHHDFDFSHFEDHEPREVDYWLKKHFLDPKLVSPMTTMPDLNLSTADAEALTAYSLSLRQRVMPSSFDAHELKYRPGYKQSTGEELYKMFCVACHGAEGRGSAVPGISAPALNNRDTLAMATDEFYRHTIDKGRSGTLMPTWGPDSGNLSDEEIDRIVAYIRTWEDEGAGITEVQSKLGDPAKGQEHYALRCGNCHGVDGEGGIGNTLNSATFLAAASDRFLAESIIEGRDGTAMASWKHLPSETVSDLLAYLRSWQGEAPAFDDVQTKMKTSDPQQQIEAAGDLYYENCAACHGIAGEGVIGPRLNNQDFLTAVDDWYLYRAIVDGRPTTAMPAWRHFTSDEIANLMTLIRSWQTENGVNPETVPKNGDPALGEAFYTMACIECHGENGQGRTASQLANPVFLSTASDDMLHHMIGEGLAGTDMPGYLPEGEGKPNLTSAQIVHIISYLRSLEDLPKVVIPKSGTGDITKGEEVYMETCVLCHGEKGDSPAGPQLNNPIFLRSASDGYLKATIALGRSETDMQPMIDPEEGMSEVTPDNVQDVIAFIRQWENPVPGWDRRPMVDGSEETITAGEEKYTLHCAECHGPEGLGLQGELEEFAPALNNPEFLESASDSFLLATIARGRAGTRMEPYGIGAGGVAELGTTDIYQIVTYIRSWQENQTSGEGPQEVEATP